jgi:hypoxanthine phosphoribosyltransferase
VATLLEKPARARTQVPIDYKGFVIDDVFVVGYGLDYAERYRNLSFIGLMKGK